MQNWPSVIHVVEDPDAARLFRHRQHEFVLSERHSDGWYPSWNHQSGAFKFRYLKRLSDRLTGSRIEVDPPYIEETAAPRNEINRPTIRRPARLVVPLLAIGNACPRAARGRNHEEGGFGVGCVCDSLKDNPSTVRRKVWLVEFIRRIGRNNLLRRGFRMRCRSNRN